MRNQYGCVVRDVWEPTISWAIFVNTHNAISGVLPEWITVVFIIFDGVERFLQVVSVQACPPTAQNQILDSEG